MRSFGVCGGISMLRISFGALALRSAAACWAMTAGAAALAQTLADASPGAAGPAPPGSIPDTSALPELVVTAQHLDEARQQIQTKTGASTYTIDSQAISTAPGGENVELNQVILQAPDVVQDSFGQFHVRGEHAGLQYRINGIILPEGISVFGQTLDPRLIASVSLLTGALPAEYGLRSAGIV